MDNDIALLEAKKSFFNKINLKNKVNKTRLEELDLDNLGIELNYQQVDLMNLLNQNELSYKKYQDNLLSINDFLKDENELSRHLLILKDLINDEKLPINVRSTLNRIYQETISNNKITDEMLILTLYRLISKLSMDFQRYIYDKLNNLHKIEYEGIKDLDIKSCQNMKNILKNYTSLTIKDVCGYKHYVNYNGSYNKNNLENMLDFAYENDKQVRIKDLISYDNFPFYFEGSSKEIVKQKLSKYIDDITKYFKKYNAIHTRMDRKNIIRSIDVLSSLIKSTNDKNKEGWLSVLTLYDLLDVIKIAKSNLPDVSFVYNEDNLQNKDNRKKLLEIIKQIKQYEKDNQVKLIDTIGIKMHADLDLLQDDIVEMFNDLSELKMPIAITEFDLCATCDMLLVNNQSEIEILKERFISDFYNLITSLKLSNKITFDSVNISSISDNQNPVLTIINKERIKQNLPKLKTIYGGFYTNNLTHKETIPVSNKASQKGSIDLFYGIVIIIMLAFIIGVVCLIFFKNL